jgi:glycosyltransferase involved in cell wall biosynthesis
MAATFTEELMRVALLAHQAPAGDAIGAHTAEKVAFFLERGVDVRLLVESDRRLVSAVRAYTSVLVADQPEPDALKFLATADLVVVDYGHFYPLLHLLPGLCGGRARILFDYHGVTPRELWTGEGRAMVEAAARWRGLVWCADFALVHSRFARQELQQATGFPSERIGNLGYVVDGARFQPGSASRDLRAALNLGAATVLLFVGRLAPNKRVSVLIEALAHLGDLFPPVHLVLVGDGTDVYQAELQRCREQAVALGIEDRLHYIGQVSEQRLLDAYRSADVLVLPSRHEGFGTPIAEAMACGVPVIGARAGALPETIAGAGLTFCPDDAGDLARQVRRVVLNSSPRALPFPSPPVLGGGGAGVRGAEACSRFPLTPDPSPPEYRGRGENRCAGGAMSHVPRHKPPRERRAQLRVAVVSFRYGSDFVGGAETSLRTIAESLQRAGHAVEVFTTCTRSVSQWTNDLPEGMSTLAGLPVHRFRVDPCNAARHLETVRAVREADGDVPAEVGRDYFAHSIQSSRLLEALRRRIDEFDAVVIGPYLLGLTYAVARAFPSKTVLLPCFHDEGFARLSAAREVYEQVGAILYHSPEERDFAEQRLGVNHPYGACIGTWIDTTTVGNPARAAGCLAGVNKYVVYCGRYSEHKGLPRLLEFGRRYQERSPERFTFVFMGEGEVAIPAGPWARDLGFIDDDTKRAVLAGADALVQLSCQESLSLVTLEAWAQGTPVIADAGSAVLAGLVRRSGGGDLIHNFNTFAAALDDVWRHPQSWRARGTRGKAYVRTEYGSCDEFAANIVKPIKDLSIPMKEHMRRRGLERAAAFDRNAWRARFGAVVDDLLHAESRPLRRQVDVQPRVSFRNVPRGSRTVLIPVRVTNAGTHVLVPEGQGRTILRCRVLDEASAPPVADAPGSPGQCDLPDLLLPGRSLSAALPVPVPQTVGSFAVCFWAQPSAGLAPEPMPAPSLRLIVEPATVHSSGACCSPLLQQAEAALVEAQRLQRLPDNYTDMTAGWLARWKRWIKRKLLGNFKHAYVDVLSRQQSAVNSQMTTALRELTACCATLDHALRQLQQQREGQAQITQAHNQCGAGAPAREQKADAECFPAESNEVTRVP